MIMAIFSNINKLELFKYFNPSQEGFVLLSKGGDMRQFKKSSLIVIILSFWVISLFAQPPDTLWTKTYGGSSQDYAFSVQLTSDGGYIMVGQTFSFGNGSNDVYLVKTDANGHTLWTGTYGGAYEDLGRCVRQTSDGGYIIVGFTTSFGAGNRDVYLIKTNEYGIALWTKTFGGLYEERGYWVQQTSDDGYIIVGQTRSFGAGGGDVYLIKTDSMGNTIWTKTFGGPGYDFCRSVQQTPDGGYILAGQTGSFGAGDWDMYLIKTDANGDSLWTRTYGGPDEDLGCSVGLTSDGGYIVTGGAKSFGGINWDVYLVKTDFVGNAKWSKLYGSSGEERCHEVFETSDGGYIAVGFTSSFGAGAYDIYLIKTNANGDSLWTKTWGGYGSDVGEGIQETPDGGYILCGLTGSFGAGGGDFWLIKTKPTTVMIDAGVTQILSPTGNIYQGSNIIPKAVVRNFSTAEATFPVVFQINPPAMLGYLNERVHQVTEDGNYSDTVEITLPAGAIDTVEFATWEAILGEYNTISYTILTGDENPSNDTAYGKFEVIPVTGHDVGVLEILEPLDTIIAGTNVTPTAVFKNFGGYDESFFVFLQIGCVYFGCRFISLGAGQTTTVAFDPWVAVAGYYNEGAATHLETDENPDNDTMTKWLTVIETKEVKLFRPYPNPTAYNLAISFALPRPSNVEITIYNVNGQIVKTLISDTKPTGKYLINTDCQKLGSGVYIVRMKADKFEAIEKFIVTK